MLISMLSTYQADPTDLTIILLELRSSLTNGFLLVLGTELLPLQPVEH